VISFALLQKARGSLADRCAKKESAADYSPLPLGEGQGEGAKRREKRKKVWGCSLLANPSPQPSPKGRGRLEDGDLALTTDRFLAHCLHHDH